FDSRRGAKFGGCWRFVGGASETLLPPMADDVVSIGERLRAHDPLFVGNGAERNRSRIEERGGRAAHAPVGGCAGALVRIHALNEDATSVDAAHWQPDYVRAPHVTVPRDMRGGGRPGAAHAASPSAGERGGPQ